MWSDTPPHPFHRGMTTSYQIFFGRRASVFLHHHHDVNDTRRRAPYVEFLIEVAVAVCWKILTPVPCPCATELRPKLSFSASSILGHGNAIPDVRFQSRNGQDGSQRLSIIIARKPEPAHAQGFPQKLIHLILRVCSDRMQVSAEFGFVARQQKQRCYQQFTTGTLQRNQCRRERAKPFQAVFVQVSSPSLFWFWTGLAIGMR